MFRLLFRTLIASILPLLMAAPALAQDTLTIFAAASLKTALDEINARFMAETRITVRVSYAASSALARQIEQGAPADVFASADADWMDYLNARALLHPETRRNLLGNRLVMIAPAASSVSAVELRPGELTRTLAQGRLALAEITSVPAGRYAKAALTKLGLWSEVETRLAMADNVRSALLFVARGEAPLGIVYASDVVAEPGVKIVAAFPAASHPPIVYPFAATARGKAEPSVRYLDWLGRKEIRAIFARWGFSILDP